MTALRNTSNNVVNKSTTSWPFRRNYRQTMETKGRTMIHHKIEWMNTQWENHETLGLNLKQLLILWTNCKQFVLFREWHSLVLLNRKISWNFGCYFIFFSFILNQKLHKTLSEALENDFNIWTKLELKNDDFVIRRSDYLCKYRKYDGNKIGIVIKHHD